MSLQTTILSFLKTQEDYKQIKQYVDRVVNKDQTIYEPICEAIIQALKQKEPELTLMAVRLGKQTVEKKNTDFNTMFQKICLPYYEKIAEFKKDDHNDDRGKFYFSDQPDKNQAKFGISILRFILESLEIWAKVFTCKSDNITLSPFFLTYARLMVKKIKFPDKYNYFNKEEVDQNTTLMFKQHSRNYAQALEENKSIIKSQPNQLNQQDQPFKQTQQNQINQVQKPSTINTRGNENQKEINSSAQLLINQYSVLKTQLIERALSLDSKAINQYIKDLKDVNQSLNQLKEKIDRKADELLSQEDEDCSLELFNVQDEIRNFCLIFQKLQNEEIKPQEYRNEFEKYRKQAPKQQKGNLQSIYEETENSQSSMQFGKVDKKFVPNMNIDSLGLQYNTEQVMQDFQNQLSGITEQHEKEKQKIQREHEIEITNLKRQMQEQAQEFKKKETRYKDIEQQYTELQRQRNNSSQSSEEVKRINNTLTDQIKTLKFQIEQLQSLSEKDSQDINYMRNHISELKEELDEKKDQIENLKKSQNLEKNQYIVNLQQQEEHYKQEIKQLQEQIKLVSFSHLNNSEISPNGEISNLLRRLENEKTRSTNLMIEINHKDEQIQILEQELKLKIIELEQYKAQQNVKFTAQDLQIQQKHQAEILSFKQQLLQLETQRKIEENSFKEKLNLLEQKFQIQVKENEKLRNQSSALMRQNQEVIEQLESLKNQKPLESIQIEPQKEIFHNHLDLSKIKETEYIQINAPQSVSSKQNYSQAIYPSRSNKQEKNISNLPYSGYQHFQHIQVEFLDNVKNLFIKTQQIKVPVQSEIIYPYFTAEEYYQKKVRPHKGIVVQFQSLLNILVMNQNHLLLYKMYHLNKIGNTIFIDNQDLKIAVLKQVQKQGNDFYINYGLYFKTEQQSLNLKAYIKNAMKFETIWTSQTEIQQNLQKRQIQLLEVSIKSNLSEILVIPILEVNYNNKIQQVFLPIQILSLIQYYKISKIVYQRKWKSAKVYRSEMFEYNTIILSNHRDIPKLSECFTILSPEKIDSFSQGLDEIKYFAYFKLQYYGIEGIIKFELMPNNKMIIFVGIENPKNVAVIKDLINAFYDIFM
ncbi:unnamed protein product [Paramecium sonneborni]|uniref:Uncharacterized protein n=1 Tax=Paramecium sonneborni TaxID=65129 RepID=A0A8S1NGQ3_9CILI|nr:unnamed protein product [Paramecium sonneborni]